MEKEFDDLLEKRFNIKFKDESLLDEAFTQASYVNEHPGKNLKFYERIEFLGDAVYELVVSEYIYKRYPNLPQGRLTRLRAAMVNEHSFSSFARDSLLCDIFESFIGAVYLDQGMEPVVKFCHQVIFPKLDEGWFDEFFDHKTELQELAQSNGPVDIEYHLLDENGPENDRRFKVSVTIDGVEKGIGLGHSKKNAEQGAAKKAIKNLTE